MGGGCGGCIPSQMCFQWEKYGGLDGTFEWFDSTGVIQYVCLFYRYRTNVAVRSHCFGGVDCDCVWIKHWNYGVILCTSVTVLSIKVSNYTSRKVKQCPISFGCIFTW